MNVVVLGLLAGVCRGDKQSWKRVGRIVGGAWRD